MSHAHTDTFQLPLWLQQMMDPKQPKKRKHTPEFVFSSMRAMGKGSMASRVNNFAKIFYESAGITVSEQNLPSQTTYRRWRYGMHYICMVQVGEILTRAIRNGDTQLIITCDGTPVMYTTIFALTHIMTSHTHTYFHFRIGGRVSRGGSSNKIQRRTSIDRATHSREQRCPDKWQ